MTTVNSAQEEFDRKYISSSEICKTLQISRPTLMSARKRGLLPDPIAIGNQIYLWERERVKENLDAWAIILKVRRA